MAYLSFSGKARSLLDAVLVSSPVQPVLRARTSKRLVVLAYHDIRNPETFRMHVEYVKRTMQTVSLAQVLECLRGYSTLPRNAVLVTFDDADRTIYEHAVPILQCEDVPAVAFVVAGHLDTDRPFWWNEVEHLIARGARARGLVENPNASINVLKRMSDTDRRQKIRALRRSVPDVRIRAEQLKSCELSHLEASGIAIGNHTLTHPILDRCSDRRIYSEVLRSHSVLTKATGKKPLAFAYPNGNYDPRVAEVLKELGYEVGFLFDHQVGSFPPQDRLRLSRVRVSSTTPLNRLRLILSGFHPAIHQAIGRS